MHVYFFRNGSVPSCKMCRHWQVVQTEIYRGEGQHFSEDLIIRYIHINSANLKYCMSNKSWPILQSESLHEKWTYGTYNYYGNDIPSEERQSDKAYYTNNMGGGGHYSNIISAYYYQHMNIEYPFLHKNWILGVERGGLNWCLKLSRTSSWSWQ